MVFYQIVLWYYGFLEGVRDEGQGFALIKVQPHPKFFNFFGGI